MPADLIDMSLPVQMQAFSGEYAYDQGIQLSWTTQSEMNSAGFHILRSESPDAALESWTRVTGLMIPGQGNSSSAHDYLFTDSNVGWDKTYYYQIHEISTVFGDTSRTYYGPLAVATKAVNSALSVDEMLRAVTGWETSSHELVRFGERRLHLMRVYNLREGLTAAADTLPARFFDDPIHKSGRFDGKRLDREQFVSAVRTYYQMMGWDDAGRPLLETLIDHQLEWTCE